MPRGANQKIKVLYLMKMLLENTDDQHGMTLAEISGALRELGVEAERKTLYDDLEVLRQFGLDVEQRKEDGTVRYHVVSREFELPELKLLVDAVQSSKFITHKKSGELIKKIEGFASRYEGQQLQRQVFVANRIKTMNESIYYAVDKLHEAINSSVRVSFLYFGWNEKKEKQLRHDGARIVVSPWALTWDDENYYLIAYDSADGKVKHYRVDKMLDILLTDEKRDGAALFRDFDMALYSKKTFGMYGGKEETVRLLCSNSMAGIIIDRFGQDVPFIKADDGHFTVYVKVYTSPLFFTWLMNFGPDVRIVSPENVRDDFVKLAKQALEQYEQTE